MALVDFFLKIDGIEGESADSKHKGEIDIHSFSWGAQNAGTFAHGGGGGAGKVSMQDFHFTMNVNKSSVKLMLACAGGDHIKSSILTCRKAGKDQQEYFKITFSDVLVSSFQTGGNEGATVPMDSISLNFSKAEWSYKEQKADGTLGGEIKAGWDLKLNKKV
jgi:type VI secretion system secreted protein Hcp